MESILEIADLVIAQAFTTAAEKIQAVLDKGDITDEHKNKLYFYRAVCHSELGNHDAALKDLDTCEDALGNTGSWLFRYGHAQFMTEDFSNALIYFKRADEAKDVHDEGLKKRIQTWMRKTQLELGNPSVGNINDAIFMTNEAPMSSKAAEASTENQSNEETKTTHSEVSSDARDITEISHDWYQNNEYVFLSVLKKKLKGECRVSLTNENIEIQFPTGENFVVHLAYSINATDSTYTQTDKKVEIKLKKKEHGIVWGALAKEQVAQKPKEVLPSYPTSNPKKKNWDSVNKEIEKEFVKEKPEGDEAMNNLLKQIYAGADEETRRAMIKSYQTSNGTVLSTSWGDVKDKDYEGKDYVAPPDHFIAKKPEY